MEAPKCQLCGKRHWSTQDCSANTIDSEMVANTTNVVANVVANSRSSSTEEQRFCKPNVEGSIPSSGSKHGVYADKEKRREYQREYMRKKRAEKRGVNEQV